MKMQNGDAAQSLWKSDLLLLNFAVAVDINCAQSRHGRLDIFTVDLTHAQDPTTQISVELAEAIGVKIDVNSTTAVQIDHLENHLNLIHQIHRE